MDKRQCPYYYWEEQQENKLKALNIHLSGLFLTWKGLTETHEVKILTYFRKTMEMILKAW